MAGASAGGASDSKCDSVVGGSALAAGASERRQVLLSVSSPGASVLGESAGEALPASVRPVATATVEAALVAVGLVLAAESAAAVVAAACGEFARACFGFVAAGVEAMAPTASIAGELAVVAVAPPAGELAVVAVAAPSGELAEVAVAKAAAAVPLSVALGATAARALCCDYCHGEKRPEIRKVGNKQPR